MALMKEFPVVGALCLRKDFWDRHGANIATRKGEMYGERLFHFFSSKKTILERNQHFFAADLS